MDLRRLARNAANAERRRARINDRMRRIGKTGRGYAMWDKDETALIRRHYQDIKFLQQKLPRRSRTAIRQKARLMGLTRRFEPWTGAGIAKLRRLWPRASRDDVRKAFPNYSWSRIYSKACKLRIKRNRQHRPADHPFIEEIRKRGRSLNLSLPDIDRMAGAPSYFKNSCRKRNPRIHWLIKAIEALDGHIEIVWH